MCEPAILNRITEALRDLSEDSAREVLDFAEFLKARRGEDEKARQAMDYEQARQRALAMLDHPPFALNGRYWSRESLYDRL